MNWEALKANLERLPSCIPRGHRITYFKYILYGLPTTSRLRFIGSVEVLDCPFCGMSRGDNRRHWIDCLILRRVFDDLYAGTTGLAMHQDSFNLHVMLDGREFQLGNAVAFSYVAIR